MLKGYLLLDTERTYANIDRKLNGDNHKNGQNLQQYMSDSPWESGPVFRDVQQDIGAMPFLQGGSLNFDETADECAGTKKAGASRQYLGRQGKTDLGQVVVLGSYYKDGHWLLTDAELFLPEEWFDPAHKKQWKRLHIPPGRTFGTKVEMARQQFLRAVEGGLPFSTVGFDSLYGRDVAFRRLAAQHGKHYMACVPSDSQVWLEDPAKNPCAERALAHELLPRLSFEVIETRHGERGALRHEHAFAEVWTQQRLPKSPDAPLGYVFHRETLVVRKEHDGKTSFALSDYLPEQKLPMAQARAERYFVERTIQDCKSELGFDELQALKYRALMHTLALCSVALLYMADLKMKLRQGQSDIREVQEQFPDVQRLPDLSLSNVKELLKATFQLPTLNKKQAVDLVVGHLFRRTCSTQSRQKKNSS
jgi:SRSO17 transposase